MEQQTQAPKQRVVQITSLEHFAAITGDWFFTKHQQLEQLINFPEHEQLMVTDNKTGVEQILVGAERAAFMEGLKVAATLFDKLPFDFFPVDAEGNPIVPGQEPPVVRAPTLVPDEATNETAPE
ncbi:hypothetical protein [Acinetobacter sp. A47]|uniref:hypothetical protein n=1 Tax=Acinetobacter sp. A47 TaxID=1561217 RepID=UPI0005700DEF|nr:hypothetical protein [Acinetobacter sp. A47]